MGKIPQPNYTQIPNILLDEWMAEMDSTELRIVLAIARQTFGWHKRRAKMSISFLQKATGLSRQGTINGLKKATERGVVNRRKSGESWEYELCLKEKDVNSVDIPPALTSQLSVPPLVNSVDQQEPPASQLSVPKERKEEKEREKERSSPSYAGGPTAAVDDWEADRDDPFYSALARHYEEKIGQVLTASKSMLLKTLIEEYTAPEIATAISTVGDRIMDGQRIVSPLTYAATILQTQRQRSQKHGQQEQPVVETETAEELEAARKEWQSIPFATTKH